MNITREQIEKAAAALGHSETGVAAMTDLFRFLDRRGHNLDGENQRAVLVILVGAWSGHMGTALDAMRERSGEGQP